MIERAKTFKHSSSVISRLNWLVVFVVVSFTAELLGIFVSGNFLIDEFSNIHVINRLLDLTTTAAESVEGASQTLTKASYDRSELVDLHRIYEVGYTHADESLSQAIQLSVKNPEINQLLKKAREELVEFNQSSRRFFSSDQQLDYKRKASAVDLLMAQEYKIELSESLRKTQILTKEQGTIAFENIYNLRYLPLIVATILTILCISFTIISSGILIRRLRKSIDNLLQATKEVISGDLSYQAPILENDEIGWFTFIFNQMVNKLFKGQNNLSRLYTISATLSSTAEPEQVAEVILRESLSALNASSGIVVQFSSIDSDFEKIANLGYGEEEALDWEQYRTDKKSPLLDAFHTQQPIWIESLTEHQKRWPRLAVRHTVFSYVVLPLSVGGSALGAMLIFFDHARVFNREDREFCLSIARQCAHALNRAQLYKEAQRAVRLRDDFLSIASHELRTPITPLKLQVQNLLRIIEKRKLSTLTHEQTLKIVCTADAQINRLTKLVDELLDVTRITTGNIELRKEKVDLSKTVSDIFNRFKSELAAVKCDVSLDLEENLFAEIDHSRIEQVVTNLLSNAMRYGAGKPIEISTARVGQRYVEIRIQDHGIGIDQKDQKRIFDRFERASSTTNFGGLGLGLFIVHQIVQSHNGTIRVKSSIGEGAAFIVKLPYESSDYQKLCAEVNA